jgi:hypothetical protein
MEIAQQKLCLSHSLKSSFGSDPRASWPSAADKSVFVKMMRNLAALPEKAETWAKENGIAAAPFTDDQ